MKHATRYLAVFALLALVTGPGMADPPAEKGKGNDQSAQQGNPSLQQANDKSQQGNKPASQGEQHGNKDGSNYRADDRDGDRYDDHDTSKNDANHGQVVSECNHRANQRNLKGQDRKQWVEWCTDHGQRFSYENRYWTNDRTCYQNADNRNLSGDTRRAYVRDCLSKVDRTRYDYNERGEPRGKDVPGKGSK
jgi:hypothetical protein